MEVNSFSSRFREIIECNGFMLNFSEPTSLTNKTKTCFDNITTQRNDNILHRFNLEIGLPDHRALFTNLPPMNKLKLLRNWITIRKRIFVKKKIKEVA